MTTTRFHSVISGMRRTARGLETFGEATRIKGHATYDEAKAVLDEARRLYPEWGIFEVRGSDPGLREVFEWSGDAPARLTYREAAVRDRSGFSRMEVTRA